MKFKVDPKLLGKKLTELRLKSNLSQSKISKICEVNSAQYISNIERGQCLPSLNILKKMLTNYNVSKEDKTEMIQMFIKAAERELENIFDVELAMNPKIDFSEPAPRNLEIISENKPSAVPPVKLSSRYFFGQAINAAAHVYE